MIRKLLLVFVLIRIDLFILWLVMTSTSLFLNFIFIMSHTSTVGFVNAIFSKGSASSIDPINITIFFKISTFHILYADNLFLVSLCDMDKHGIILNNLQGTLT